MRCTMKFLTIILYKHLPPHKHIKPLIGLCRRCIFGLFQIDTASVFGIWMASYEYIQVISIYNRYTSKAIYLASK